MKPAFTVEFYFHLSNVIPVMKSDTMMRFAFIETRVYWGGGLTAQQLATAFDLSRPHAQTVIDEYCRLHPQSLQFDSKRRRQIAGPSFQLHYIRAAPALFLDYVRGQALTAYYLENSDWVDTPFEDVDRLLTPRIQRHPLQAALQGLYEQKAVILHYRAKTGTSFREVSPHHLVFASNRYHLRVFCHITGCFLDFVLSRILHSEPSTTPWVSARHDHEWNKIVMLTFKINMQLPLEAQEALRCDFMLDDHDQLSIHSREALALYVRRHMLTVDKKFHIPRWTECVSSIE